MTLSALHDKWIAERPHYEELCRDVEAILKCATQQRGVRCRTSARAKTIDRLLKKALRNQYEDPFQDIQDKAGVRVICTYQDSLPILEEVVRNCFIVREYENKAVGLSYDRLGYQGIHFEVTLGPDSVFTNPQLEGKLCEIQLLTEAQNLWANVSHGLVYKPSQEPPEAVKRRVYDQMALLRMFDDQVVLARNEAMTAPGFQEAVMLEDLERCFYRLTAETSDRELSLYILGALKPLFRDAELDGFQVLVEEFLESRWGDLDQIFRDYAETSRRSPILFQPESIAIFMCLERDIFSLKEAWAQVLPLDEL